MSSPCRVELLLIAALLAGCHRETRDFEGHALRSSDRAEAYQTSAWHIAQGQRLFGWMNCVGCHSHGGGGIGPPLRDGEWRYGSSPDEIVATIMNGRPNGMPSFRGKLTENQAYEIAAFVRSMSGQPRLDVVAARADEPQNTKPLTLTERRDIRNVSVADDAKTIP